jgi:hypothetical protein
MFKRGKKGQVALFIIIAVVVVALGVMAYLLWPQISGIFMSQAQSQAYLSSQAGPLQDAVYYCVSSVSEDIIREQGKHAGYYSYSHLYALDYAGPKLVVMYKDANMARLNELPSLPMIQSEFGKALETEGYAKIDSCLNNFASFKKKMAVEPGERTINAEIQDENVMVKVDWPITISKGKSTSTLPQKDVELSIPLGKVWTVANDIVNSETRQENFILNYESYIRSHDSLMKDVRINIQNYPTSDQTVYMITAVPKANQKEFAFNFAVDRL